MKVKAFPLVMLLLISCASSGPLASSSSSEVLPALNVLNSNLYEGYWSYPVRAYFAEQPVTNPDLYYEIADDQIAVIDNNMILPIRVGTTLVTASTSDGREDTFQVRVKPISEWRFNPDVLSREEDFQLSIKPNPHPTLFIGDSFFDPRLFWRSFYEDFDELNCFAAGISSSKADDWIHFRKRLIYDFSPKQIVMHIGTNDINDSENPTFTVTDYYDQIVRFLNLVINELPAVPIYFFGIENRSEASGYSAKNIYVEMVTAKLKNEFALLHEGRFIYIDSPAVFNLDTNRYLASDGIHPSAAGYQYYVDTLKGLLDF